MLPFAVIGLWACADEPEVPEVPEALEVLPSDIEALKLIHNQLGVDSEDYPAYWNPEDQSTWKNAGIELDTIIDEETQTRNLAVSALTLYVTREKGYLPVGLLGLANLKDLKVYACAGSYFDGKFIPQTVTSLLVDRLNPDDPGYIIGVMDSHDRVVLGRLRAHFNKLTIHGVDMNEILFQIHFAADIDLSHNTLRGEVPTFIGEMGKYTKNPINLSYNQYHRLLGGFEGWEYWPIPLLQYNDFEDIPPKVLKSDLWKKYHEHFIGNPGYVAPKQ